MKVDIIIPAFNAQKYLSSTIVSAIQQAVVREIVVVDDGSSDDTFGIAKSFKPGVKAITGPNSGVSMARNRGIAESTGEWLIFLDADDQLLPGTVEKRLEAAAQNPLADVVVCGWQELIDTGGGTANGNVRAIDRAAMEEDAEVATAAHVWAPPAALMYRRALVERIGGFRRDLPVIQDARFLFDAAYHGAHFAFSDHVGTLYRIQPGSLSRRSPAQFWRDCLLNGAQIEALWSQRGGMSAAQRQALAGIYNCAAQALFRLSEPAYRSALAELRRSGLPTAWRTRSAEIGANVLGLNLAARLANSATWLRGSVRSLRPGPSSQS